MLISDAISFLDSNIDVRFVIEEFGEQFKIVVQFDATGTGFVSEYLTEIKDMLGPENDQVFKSRSDAESTLDAIHGSVLLLKNGR